jgi:polyphosphate glucokinase
LGPKKWQAVVHDILPALKSAMMADYVVLGGGSVKKIDQLPDGTRRGHNRTVVEGGRRLWEELPDPTKTTESGWLIL